ncbi:MAG: di-heme enzyme [Gammaproteobacteria bacterium]
MLQKIIPLLLLLAHLSACHPLDESRIPYDWQLPDDVPAPKTPDNNPMTAAKVALGRHIFYDTNLSANQQQACSSCHIQANAFAEPKTTSEGSTGEKHRRNASALINVAYNQTLTWAHDSITDIETLILLPLFGESPIEMGITGNEDQVLARFQTERYQAQFAEAFPGEPIDFAAIAKALACFVRSLTSFDSPFDRYVFAGDDSALSASAIRGMDLFFSEKLECDHCHGNFNFSESSTHENLTLNEKPFHNIGLYNLNNNGAYPASDNGLYDITLNPNDRGRFRAPTLRNIALTAPYMHDGSINTLEAVIDLYAAGGRTITEGENQGDGRKNPLKNAFIAGFDITDQEKQDLIAFLNALTDTTFITNPTFGAPDQSATSGQ